MTGYRVSFDSARAILRCKLFRGIENADVQDLCVDLHQGLEEARGFGSIRLLWDHRDIGILMDERGDRLMTIVRNQFQDGDRTAVLLANSLQKAACRQRVLHASVFLSENAALTWLNIGATQAA